MVIEEDRETGALGACRPFSLNDIKAVQIIRVSGSSSHLDQPTSDKSAELTIPGSSAPRSAESAHFLRTYELFNGRCEFAQHLIVLAAHDSCQV